MVQCLACLLLQTLTFSSSYKYFGLKIWAQLFVKESRKKCTLPAVVAAVILDGHQVGQGSWLRPVRLHSAGGHPPRRSRHLRHGRRRPPLHHQRGTRHGSFAVLAVTMGIIPVFDFPGRRVSSGEERGKCRKDQDQPVYRSPTNFFTALHIICYYW